MPQHQTTRVQLRKILQPMRCHLLFGSPVLISLYLESLLLFSSIFMQYTSSCNTPLLSRSLPACFVIYPVLCPRALSPCSVPVLCPRAPFLCSVQSYIIDCADCCADAPASDAISTTTRYHRITRRSGSRASGSGALPSMRG